MNPCSDTDDDFAFVTLADAMRDMIDSIRKLHEMEAEERKLASEKARATLSRAGKYREESGSGTGALDGVMNTPRRDGIRQTRPQCLPRSGHRKPIAGGAFTAFPTHSDGIRNH